MLCIRPVARLFFASRSSPKRWKSAIYRCEKMPLRPVFLRDSEGANATRGGVEGPRECILCHTVSGRSHKEERANPLLGLPSRSISKNSRCWKVCLADPPASLQRKSKGEGKRTS